MANRKLCSKRISFLFEGNWNFLRRKILFLSDINSGPFRPSQTHSEEIQGSYAIASKKRKKMPKIKPVYSLLPPEEAKKEDQKQQLPIDQEGKYNLTFENDENRNKNAAGTNKTDAKIGKSDANPGQIKEKKIKEKKIKENFLKIQVKGEGEKFENLEFDRWRKELLDDEDWCVSPEMTRATLPPPSAASICPRRPARRSSTARRWPGS